MSDNLKIAILILAFIPLTLLLKKFFDGFENHKRSQDGLDEEEMESNDKKG